MNKWNETKLVRAINSYLFFTIFFYAWLDSKWSKKVFIKNILNDNKKNYIGVKEIVMNMKNTIGRWKFFKFWGGRIHWNVSAVNIRKIMKTHFNCK